MAIAVFDTFTIAQAFEKVGFPKDHAKVVIEALVSCRSDPDTVSKAELREHKTEVKASIEKHDSKVLQAIAALDTKFSHAISDLRKDNEIMKRDLTIRLAGMVISGAGLIIASITLILKALLPS